MNHEISNSNPALAGAVRAHPRHSRRARQGRDRDRRRAPAERVGGGGSPVGDGARDPAGVRTEGRDLAAAGPAREPPRPGRSRSFPRPVGDVMAAGTPRDEGPSIRRHLVGGAIIALMLTGGLGGWAATTELSGAVIASGSVVVDSNVKKVQQLTGGIVGELLVRDGSRVRTGDVVVRLDETIMRANLAIVVKGLAEMNARQARLASERDRAEITFPAALLAREHDPDVARAIDSERKLFE